MVLNDFYCFCVALSMSGRKEASPAQLSHEGKLLADKPQKQGHTKGHPLKW